MYIYFTELLCIPKRWIAIEIIVSKFTGILAPSGIFRMLLICQFLDCHITVVKAHKDINYDKRDILLSYAGYR